MSVTKLASFLASIDGYVATYRSAYAVAPTTNIPLKYLSNTYPNTLIINCCSVEPEVNKEDYWYDGSILRKCTSNTPNGVWRKTYIPCLTYETTFSSNLVRLTPDVVVPVVSPTTTTTTARPPVESGDYLLKAGGTLHGALTLWRDPQADLEAAPKQYVDAKVAVATTNITNLQEEVVLLNQAVEEVSTQLADLDLASSLLFYTHLQPILSANWQVLHYKGSSNFVCTVFDASGVMVLPDSLQAVDPNTVAITFAQPCSGKATFFLHR